MREFLFLFLPLKLNFQKSSVCPERKNIYFKHQISLFYAPACFLYHVETGVFKAQKAFIFFLAQYFFVLFPASVVYALLYGFCIFYFPIGVFLNLTLEEEASSSSTR
jgi:hypothetical protein